MAGVSLNLHVGEVQAHAAGQLEKEVAEKLLASFLAVEKIEALDEERSEERSTIEQVPGHRIVEFQRILKELNLDSERSRPDQKQIDQTVVLCHLTDKLRKELRISRDLPMYLEVFALWCYHKEEIQKLAETLRAQAPSWMDQESGYTKTFKTYYKEYVLPKSSGFCCFC